MNIKNLLRNVPQPWKTYLARTALVPMILIGVPVTAVIEGCGWLREIAKEMADAWTEVRSW